MTPAEMLARIADLEAQVRYLTADRDAEAAFRAACLRELSPEWPEPLEPKVVRDVPAALRRRATA